MASSYDLSQQYSNNVHQGCIFTVSITHQILTVEGSDDYIALCATVNMWRGMLGLINLPHKYRWNCSGLPQIHPRSLLYRLSKFAYLLKHDMLRSGFRGRGPRLCHFGTRHLAMLVLLTSATRTRCWGKKIASLFLKPVKICIQSPLIQQCRKQILPTGSKLGGS